jgi:hypothetical protein
VKFGRKHLWTKRQAMGYKTLDRKTKIEQLEPHINTEVISGAPER